MVKVITMPGDRPSQRDGRYADTKKARNNAIKRLIEAYQDEFNAMIDEERAKLGLHALYTKPESEPVVPSEATWVDEDELTIDDRVEWAHRGERWLAAENNEALVEVVCRTMKEPAAVDYAGVTQ